MIKPKRNVKREGFKKIQNKKYSEEEYHKRSLVEAGFSSLKKKYGRSGFSKKFKPIQIEIFCKAITGNLNLKI
jgi:transposase